MTLRLLGTLVFSILSVPAIPLGCEGDASPQGEITTLWVDSGRSPCTGVGPMECLRIKREASGPWELFYSDIEGFDYQPGYLYRIRVREEKLDPAQVPADGSSIKYTLVEITEKTPDPKLRLNDIWVLREMEGRQIADGDLMERLQRPYIEFHLRDNRYMGTDGCNTFRGALLSVGEEKLQLGPAMSTKMSCGNMELPDTFLRLLSRTDSYRVRGPDLTLMEGQTALLTFKKTD